MNCRATKSLFSAFMEGELSEADRRRMNEHLERCERCSRDLEALRKTVTLLRWIPPIEADQGFTQSVMARVRAEEARPSLGERLGAWWEGVTAVNPWRGLELPAPAMAAAGVVGLVVGVLMTVQLVGTPVTMVDATRGAGELASRPQMVGAPVVGTAVTGAAPTATMPVGYQRGPQTQTPSVGSGSSASIYDVLRRRVGQQSMPPAQTAGGSGFTGDGRYYEWQQQIHQDRIEGPEAVIAVEYVLERVRFEPRQTGQGVRQLPAGLHTENGLLTF